MNKHEEDDNQKALFQWAAHIPELKWMHAIPNGAFLAGNKLQRAKRMNRLKSQGLKPGVLDVFLPLARLGYHGLYIELKVGKNTLTEQQDNFADHAHKNGYSVHVCYSWTEAKDAICEYIGIDSL